MVFRVKYVVDCVFIGKIGEGMRICGKCVERACRNKADKSTIVSRRFTGVVFAARRTSISGRASSVFR